MAPHEHSEETAQFIADLGMRTVKRTSPFLRPDLKPDEIRALSKVIVEEIILPAARHANRAGQSQAITKALLAITEAGVHDPRVAETLGRLHDELMATPSPSAQ